MKRILCLLLSIFLLLSCTACTTDPAAAPSVTSTRFEGWLFSDTPSTVPTDPTQIEVPTKAPPTPTKHDHTFSPASCTAPKTCDSCGKTVGDPAGHVFENGRCSVCGMIAPDHTYEAMVWIPTRGGKKYHSRAGCSNMIDPDHVTLSEAEKRGFTPCKRCY